MQSLIQLFRDLLRISAGDMIPEIRIGFLKEANLSGQMTDLIGLCQSEIDIAAGDIIQCQEFLLDFICHKYEILGLGNATILVVTHDSELIRACCSRRLAFPESLPPSFENELF